MVRIPGDEIWVMEDLKCIDMNKFNGIIISVLNDINNKQKLFRQVVLFGFVLNSEARK